MLVALLEDSVTWWGPTKGCSISCVCPTVVVANFTDFTVCQCNVLIQMPGFTTCFIRIHICMYVQYAYASVECCCWTGTRLLLANDILITGCSSREKSVIAFRTRIQYHHPPHKPDTNITSLPLSSLPAETSHTQHQQPPSTNHRHHQCQHSLPCSPRYNKPAVLDHGVYIFLQHCWQRKKIAWW